MPQGREPLDVDVLFRSHHDFVRRTLLAGWVPKGLVDDAVQDVFLVALRRREDYDGTLPVTGLLRSIARNVACGYRYASGASARARPAVETFTDVASWAPSPEEAVE
jgi:RNA polymerase sigma-70 factor (ECF subfamily)